MRDVRPELPSHPSDRGSATRSLEMSEVSGRRRSRRGAERRGGANSEFADLPGSCTTEQRRPFFPAVTKVHQGGGLAASTKSVVTMHAMEPAHGRLARSRVGMRRDPRVRRGWWRMGSYVLGFDEIDQTQVEVVGGKGAKLGELSRIEGIRVPAGFCVTTEAFERIKADAPSIEGRLDGLARLSPDDRAAIRSLSAEVREALEGVAIPPDLATAIAGSLARLGEHGAYAVRSSATAEDMPTASFAGQQDTFLNVVGPPAIFEHISRCWASLYTERAVTYRLRNGFDQRKVHMAVVVQQMVFPQAAGVLFTADPVTSNRKVASVEASFGLGEALVSGLVNPDAYKVRDGEVIAKVVATKQLALQASPEGGTQERAIEPECREQPALTDAQVVRLAQLGRRIEAHFGQPQDIEWCLLGDEFQIVQSRPITSCSPSPRKATRRTTFMSPSVISR